jgi:DNA polymerase I
MRFSFITGCYRDEGLILYARDEKGEKRKLRCLDFEYYFYVPEDVKLPKMDELRRVEEGFVAIDGTKVKRLVFPTPTYVEVNREKFPKHYEADIPSVRRFLIDTGVRNGFEVPSEEFRVSEIRPVDFRVCPKVSFLDIEVYSPSRFPSPEMAEHPIVSITIWDDKSEKFVTFTLKQYFYRSEPENWIVVGFGEEDKMISKFLEYLSKVDPDVISGWNIEFDIRYLKGRCKRLGIDCDFDRYLTFDLHDGYAKLYHRSGRLKDIVIEEGLGLTAPPEFRSEWWEKDFKQLLRYNKSDVEYCVKLNRKLKIIEFFWELKQEVGLEDLEGTLYFGGVVVDTLMLRAYKNKFILPSRPKEVEKEEYEGAMVLEPPKGIIEGVAEFDMSRYYPSIIISKNLSPEGQGIIPNMLRGLIQLREKYKIELKKYEPGSPEYEMVERRDEVTKFMINSVYGYLGHPKSRLYCPEIAAKVTEIGRAGIKFLSEQYKPIYGHTDSIHLKGIPLEKVYEYEREINEKLKDFSKQIGLSEPVQVKFDRYFARVMYLAKTRYAGHCVFEKGQKADYIVIKGMEYVRRDASKLTRTLQKQVIDLILRERIEEAKNVIKQMVEGVRRGLYSIDELSIPKQIHKDLLAYENPQDFVRGAIYANKYLKQDIRRGDVVKMIFVKKMPPGYPPTDVISYIDEEALPKGIVLDKEKIIDRVIRMKVEDVLEVVGLRWDEVVGEYKTKSLLEVFSCQR